MATSSTKIAAIAGAALAVGWLTGYTPRADDVAQYKVVESWQPAPANAAASPVPTRPAPTNPSLSFGFGISAHSRSSHGVAARRQGAPAFGAAGQPTRGPRVIRFVSAAAGILFNNS